jgi:hypothetical protein
MSGAEKETMNLTKDDIVAFCDRHADVARTPENFMIAYEWACARDLQPTESNLDLAYTVNHSLFEPAPPSESEQARMGSDEFLRAVVLPELRKHSSPPQEDQHPFVRGRRGTPANRHFSDEEIEAFTAKEYREFVLGIKRGNGE